LGSSRPVDRRSTFSMTDSGLSDGGSGQKRKATSALSSLFASYGSDDDDDETAPTPDQPVNPISDGFKGIVAYGGDDVDEVEESVAMRRDTSSEGMEVGAGPSNGDGAFPSVPLGPVPAIDEAAEEPGAPTLASLIFPHVDIPPTPTKEPCPEDLQAKIVKYLELKAQGRSINSELRKSKGYRNPDFLQKIVEHFQIDEPRSHFSSEVLSIPKTTDALLISIDRLEVLRNVW